MLTHHHGDRSDATRLSLVISAPQMRRSRKSALRKFRLLTAGDAVLLRQLRTPKVTKGGGGRKVELFQKCANTSSRALISERVSAACSVCLGGGGALLALLLSQRWIDFNPHNACLTFIQRYKRWAHVCVNGPLGVRHAASRRPASGRGSVKSPLFSQDREKARAVGRTASLHFLLSSTHALLQAL